MQVSGAQVSPCPGLSWSVIPSLLHSYHPQSSSTVKSSTSRKSSLVSVTILWRGSWLDGVPDRLRRNHHALHGGMGPWSWDFLSQGPQEKRADRKSYLDGRKTRVDFNTKLFSLFSKPLDKTPHADNAMVVSESNYRSHKAGFNTTSQHAEHWSTETFS